MKEPLRVLYVDDEDDIREVVEFALEDAIELQLQLCASGAEAIARVGDFAPDLIVLDVMMPGMDGPATLQALRAAGVSAPIAFMTAKVQACDLDRFRELGAIGVIAKPFDPMQLAAQIRQLWHERAPS